MAVAGTPQIRIGTRGSPLALAQTHAVRDALCAAHGWSTDEVAITVIKTTGDQVQDRKLSEIGGKGLFTKEIEIALIANEIDLAVHSSKDMPTVLPDGLVLAGCLKRTDPRDGFISSKAKSIETLAAGATLGTASLRREAQVRLLRPDLKVVPLRGNVETRLRRVRDGDLDATILGMAGLTRLGLTGEVAQILSPDAFLPAVGQGTVCIEIRDNDAPTRGRIDAIGHRDSFVGLTAERAFLTVLEGSCRTPIAGFAEISGDDIRFRGLVMRPDGSESHATERRGAVKDAAALGEDAGRELKAKLPADFFAGLH
jgi:hydroxymethylbilane synthase